MRSVDGVSKHWTVAGSDLGWGAGGGRFTGTIDTDDLFGQVDQGFLPGTSTISLTIRSASGAGISGRFSNSALNLTLSDTLSHRGAEVSAVAGGAQDLDLDAGAGHAGETYLLLGSLSGTVPGLPLGGVTLPLNSDAYFAFTAANPGVPIVGAVGALDGAGRSTAQVVLPAGLAFLVGLEAHHAYLTIDGTGAFAFASNASTLRFTD